MVVQDIPGPFSRASLDEDGFDSPEFEEDEELEGDDLDDEFDDLDDDDEAYDEYDEFDDPADRRRHSPRESDWD
ncbi:MAG: hypothetical protein OEZ54_01350 [Gemmatimonadota bacterium]|nr:hypothetical protein [Gemmatimonadota bacterium]